MISDPSLRFELLMTIAESDYVKALVYGDEILAIGGQIPSGAGWVILSEDGVKRIKTVIRTVRSFLARGIISSGTYINEEPQYERFAKMFGLVKTSDFIERRGVTFNWWEFS